MYAVIKTGGKQYKVKEGDVITVEKIKKQAEVNLVEEVITKREVKYIYPADCQDTLSRKKHRQQVRNQLNRLELEMLRIEDKQSKEFKAKEKEYLKFKKANVKSA